MTESVLRHSLIQGYLMLDYDTTEELGCVESLLVEVAQSQVVGIVCQGPVWQRQRPVYGWQQIAHIGADSMVLQNRNSQPPSAAAQPMLGLEVWTDMGNCVGQIVDYQFERPGNIVQYFFARVEQPGLYGLAPEAIISAGRKRIMISAQVVEQAPYFPDEIVAPVPQQDWQATAQTTARSVADQVQNRAQEWSSSARDWIPDDLHEQLQSKRQELQDRTQGVRSQLNQQVSNAKKRLKPLNRALENTLENTLDKFDDQPDTPNIDLDTFEVWEDDE